MKSRIINILVIVFTVLVAHFIAYKLVHIPRRIEVIAILSLLLFYPVLRRPLVGVFIVFGLSPFIPHVRRLYYLKYSRPDIDPLIIFGDIILIIILIGLFFEFKERLDRNHPTSVYMKIIIMYFVYLLIRSFFFNFLPFTEGITHFKYYGPPVLFFLVGMIYADKIAHLKKIWYITIFVGLIASVYGIIQLYFGFSKAEQIWFSSIEFSTLFIKGVARPFSIFQAPVAFGDYILLSIIGILMCIYWIKNKVSLVLLLFIPLFSYVILLTSVRSCWIGIILIIVIWYTFFKVKGNRNRFLVLLGIVVLYTLSQFFIDVFESGLKLESVLALITKSAPDQQFVNMLITERSTALTNPFEEHSLLSRIALWKELLVYSKDPVYFFLGRGVGTLKADSLYFTYLAEFGYPGLIFIIVLLVNLTIRGFYVIDHYTDNDIIVLAKGITIMNITIAIISVTGTHIHYFPGDIYFWFFNGVLIQLYVLKKYESNITNEDVPDQTEA
jgi:hypothetical protein